MAEAHDAVFTKPGSRVTYPVSFRSLPIPRPPGPSVASVTARGSRPPLCSSPNSDIDLPLSSQALVVLVCPESLIVVSPGGPCGSVSGASYALVRGVRDLIHRVLTSETFRALLDHITLLKRRRSHHLRFGPAGFGGQESQEQVAGELVAGRALLGADPLGQG